MAAPIHLSLETNRDETVAFLKKIQPATGIYPGNYTYAGYVDLYLFALSFCSQRLVLDAAAGYGYGSTILATRASHVVGIDLNKDGISHARRRYSSDRTSFMVMDAIRTGFPDGTFDCVVSIETFEHIPPALAAPFLDEICRVLKPGGALMLSTPNRPVYSQISRTAGHINEMDVDELEQLLAPRFPVRDHYFQRKKSSKELGTFYNIIKTDRLKLRHLIPRKLRNLANHVIARNLFQDIDVLLPQLAVQKASSMDDVRDAFIQVKVCQKGAKASLEKP